MFGLEDFSHGSLQFAGKVSLTPDVENPALFPGAFDAPNFVVAAPNLDMAGLVFPP